MKLQIVPVSAASAAISMAVGRVPADSLAIDISVGVAVRPATIDGCV
ncbi:hypothetical protein [Paraburkholderia fynbosensis]|nr:hypothetical protein [Paraburkholderia fynbosensis]